MMDIRSSASNSSDSSTDKEWISHVIRGEIKTCVVEFGRGCTNTGHFFLSASILEVYMEGMAARVYISGSDRKAQFLGIGGTEMTVEIERLHPVHAHNRVTMTEQKTDFVDVLDRPSATRTGSIHRLTNLISKSLSFVSTPYSDHPWESEDQPKRNRKSSIGRDTLTVVTHARESSLFPRWTDLTSLAQSLGSMMWDDLDVVHEHRPNKSTVDTDNGLVILDDYIVYDSDEDNVPEEFRESAVSEVKDKGRERMESLIAIDESVSIHSNDKNEIRIGQVIGLCINSVMYEAKVVTKNSDGTWMVQFRGEEVLRTFRPHYIVNP